MSLLDAVLYVLALVGHAGIWIALGNHVHSRGLPRWVIKPMAKAIDAWLVLGPVVILMWAWPRGLQIVGRGDWAGVPWGLMFYFGCCWLAAIGPVPLWFWRRLTRRRAAALLASEAREHDLGQRSDARPVLHGAGRLFALLPRNEMLRLEANCKTLEVPGLPPALDGLAIAHFSDLHMTGRVAKACFHEMVDLVNQMRPDLVAVTGDLVDRAACIPWLGETLGRLEAPCGVYFILGNHDKKVDVALLRRTLVGAGLIDLGGQWKRIDVQGESVLLAGNERPWFRRAPRAEECPVEAQARVFRLLLAHTPDQYPWARQHGFDLMLAGHTHGGQIVFPLLGPVVCPSRYGVKYAAGVYHEPPTVLHVSRGASADVPLRWNCPPEITRLVLRSPARVVTERQPHAAAQG